MRLDRLLTLGLSRPAQRLGRLCSPPPGSAASVIPILMYHSIADEAERGVGDYYRTATSPARFAEHMWLLKRAGWQGVTLSEALAEPPQLGPQNAPRRVALTFDDGFRDFKTAALPILQALGFRATVYLPTAFISSSQRALRFCGRDCLRWPEIRGLSALGIEFGSHSRTHPELDTLDGAAIRSELQSSKREIESELGCAAEHFSHPFGFPAARPGYCAQLRAALQAAGYRSCVTTEIGRARRGDDRYRLRRLPVNGADDGALFRAKLEGAYDWMERPQRAYKAWKTWRALARPGV